MKHLVIVVPGIGGSVLEDARGSVWDAGLHDIAGLVTAPDRLDLSSAPSLVPTGLITSKRLLPGWTVVRGYERLLAGLGALPGAVVDDGHPFGRRLSATVAAFPYDFRRSIADAAEELGRNVEARLEALGARPGERRVIIVAHSLGGLVARYWLGPLEGWRCCRALLTLGTPHRGAPKALDWLVNGARVGPLHLRGVTELIRGWPSVFELLPRYRAVWDETTGRAGYPHDLPIAGLTTGAETAFGVHEAIERSWAEMPRGGPEMVALVGWSHRTLLGARWDGTRLKVSKRVPDWVDAPGWESDLGDGTVPAVSAVPLEMADAERGLLRVRERHSPLTDSPGVVELVAQYEERGSTAAVRGDEDQPALGLDLDEAYLAGDAVPVTVRLHHAEPTAGTEVWATVRTPGLPGKTQVRLEPDGEGAYRTEEVVAPAEGVQDIEVVASRLGGAGDLMVADSFCSVEPT